MFDRGRSTLQVDIKTLMMIDSLDMGEAEREIIVFNCKMSPYDKIVITHGTDTIVETAEIIARHNIQKTIILTGAMIPYAFGTSSDGFFNLGSALAFVQTLPHGVYVVMNGQYYLWNNVRKNKQTGYFEHL